MKINTIKKLQIEGTESQSILDSTLQSGLVFEYSCKTGQCGVCKTSLLQGEVKVLQSQIALSGQDKAKNKILTCCCAPVTDILIDAEDLSALHGIEIKTLPARVDSIRKLTTEIIEVTLRLPPTSNFNFLEGQYVDVIWNSLRRSYSIASTADQKTITLLIKRYSNGKMSDYWFDQAKENDLLRIEGPKGTFYLRDISKPLMFLATGTGIAPIFSMLQKLDSMEDFLQCEPISVFWGNRYSEEFVWQPQFKKLKVDFNFVCSRPEAEWKHGIGYVQDVALKKHQDLQQYDLYACGSNSMIQSAKEEFIAMGMSENQFHSDAFLQGY